MGRGHRMLRTLASGWLLVAGLGCPGSHPGSGDAGLIDSGNDAGPVDAGYYAGAVSVASAVTKAKTLLTGLAATEEEIRLVSLDEANLPKLIAQWRQTPEYREKMLGFFTTQFQQDQWSFTDLNFQFRGPTPFSQDIPRIVQNLQQSFGRTALALIAEGQPFSAVVTTKRYMMTPALAAVYASVDVTHVDDNYNLIDLFQQRPVEVTVQSTTPVTVEDALNPQSPSFLKFYDSAFSTSYRSGCPFGTFVYEAPASYRAAMDILYNYQPAPPRIGCETTPFVPPAERYIVDSDFTKWQMVSVRLPHAAEATTPLYALPSFRSGEPLVLNTQRVGFFTTPAFFARWPTNDSNQHRVTLNQTLLVALGRPIDLTNTTPPMSLAALNEAHAAPGSTCYECHQSLDPMRQFFTQSYTYYFSTQDRPPALGLDGQFAFHGITGQGSTVDSLAALLSTHPMFAAAWVQKLCTWANSARCDDSDPEFQRLVALFVSSNHSWNALVDALFSSPIVTNLHDSESAHTIGPLFPVTRELHLCALLSNRLGLVDVCGLDATQPTISPTIKTIASSWPSDQYSRGADAPAQASAPSPMVRGGMEALCGELALRLVNDGTSGFETSDPPTAIRGLATKLMGLSGDRVAAPAQILQDHYDAAIQMGTEENLALRSTFMLACLSPYVVGVGL